MGLGALAHLGGRRLQVLGPVEGAWQIAEFDAVVWFRRQVEADDRPSVSWLGPWC